MKETIRRFIDNGKDTGLMLLDMPTGSGKTHNVLEYICEESTKLENKDRKYFFVTTLKKNLPTEKLRQMFIAAGREREFDRKFLFIDSNADTVIEHLNEVKAMIPPAIKNFDEYRKLENAVNIVSRNLLRQKDSSDPGFDNDLKMFVDKAKEDIRKNYEPAFRHKTEELLKKEFPTIPQRAKAIETDRNWCWVSKLYPASMTRSKQIIFMSMDKFLTRNSTLIEPSYLFINSSIIKNNIIFIDEFDATKETMLNNIINSGLRDSIDYLTLFKNIHSALQMKAFPAVLTTPSDRSREYPNRWKPLAIIDSFFDKAEVIYDTYKLNFSHKTDDENEESRNFLFHDHRYHTIFQNGKSFISSHNDKERKLNIISFVNEKPKNDKINIQVMLGQIEGFITWFERGVFYLAQNYKELKDQNLSYDMREEFSFESAVESVLNLFGLENEYMQFLKNHILTEMRVKLSSPYNNAALKDSTFYQVGFRYFDFINDANDDMQSEIYMTSLQNTPEKLLLLVLERAKVIGISATATIDTVLGNFDLDYIRSNIGSDFYKPPQQDLDRMTEGFERSQNGYEGKVEIHPYMVKCESTTGWDRIFHNAMLASQAENFVRSNMPNHMDENSVKHSIERYMRITTVYMEFLKHDIQSFLCVLTKHPTDYPSELSMSVLYGLFEMIHGALDRGPFNKNSICRLDGTDYETNKDDITARLGAGEHLFVISVYQTIGAGQNLQYPIPTDRDDVVCINERTPDQDKDYDAIYLDKPTNLLVHYRNMVEMDSFLKYIYQVEYLYENGELSAYASRKLIKKAFITSLMPKNRGKSSDEGDYVPENPYKCISYANLGARTIIQAVGRICRTNMKSRHIYLYAHDEIRFFLSGLDIEARKYNVEFCSLYNDFARKPFATPAVSNLEWKGAKISEAADRNIKAFLHGREWTPDSIQQWDALRQYVLQHPTISEKDLYGSPWKFGYMKSPGMSNRYWYTQSQDYHSQQIFFDRSGKSEVIEVSEDNSLLSFLMKQEKLQDFFERNQYATSFKPDEYIMTPTLFNNIYKGALGEIVGEYICRFVCNELKRVSDMTFFEYFDYQVESLPVYIDFKNWKCSTSVDNAEELIHIKDKALLCGAKGVIVVNVYDRDRHDGSIINYGGVRILQIPSLLECDEYGKPKTNIQAKYKIVEFINDYR